MLKLEFFFRIFYYSGTYDIMVVRILFNTAAGFGLRLKTYNKVFFFRRHTLRRINRSAVFFSYTGIIVAGDKRIFYGARRLSRHSAGLEFIRTVRYLHILFHCFKHISTNGHIIKTICLTKTMNEFE